MLFLWINPILVRGYSMELGQDDMPGLDQGLSSHTLRQAILRAWDQRGMFTHYSLLFMMVFRMVSNAGLQ